MSDENTDKNDMFDAMRKAIEEGKIHFPPKDNFVYLMNTNDRMCVPKDFVPPSQQGESFTAWTNDPEIYSSDLVPKGKVYKVAKSLMFDARKPIDPPVFDVNEFETAFSRILGHSFGIPSHLFGDKLRKKVNPNWSEEWDEWRNTGRYAWEWMNRVGDWLNKKFSQSRR